MRAHRGAAGLSDGTRRPRPAELDTIERLVRDGGERLDARPVCRVAVRGASLPVWRIALGSRSPDAPAMAIVGGVHGLERIGTEVAIACLHQLVQRLDWDASLHHLLERLRLVFLPLVNPGGLWLGTRANPQGVDLMRNAPVDCSDGAPWPLGGQRLSAALPWYRGRAGAPMQPESQALCEAVERELLGRPFAIAVDCHSGFGLHDRVWFPFAHTRRPIDELPELLALAELMDASLLHHRYLMEPQSRQYLAHGDLWDHLHALGQARGRGLLLPLTLEMGSWLWVRKNPRQLFSRVGLFNPVALHRQQRVLRRHLGLLDFLMRACAAHSAWRPAADERESARQRALLRWYAPRGA